MKLSVCLIVKNEEPVLDRCLSCAARIADELIVVDTGSTDRSVEIAQGYTDKVYIHPWQNSFAEARNYSYSKATCDYVMWLDADDVIDEKNIRRFNKMKETLSEDIDVVFTLYGSIPEDGIGSYILRDRIIKRALGSVWQCVVHEGIPMDSSWNHLYATDIAIFHKKEYINEPTRNMDLFDRYIDAGNTLNDFEKCNLCKELVIAEQYERAYELFKEIKDVTDNNTYYYGLYFVARGLIDAGKYEECISEVDELDNRMPTTAYLVYLKGYCMEKLNRIEEAKECYFRAMTIEEDPTTLYIQRTGYTDYFPMLKLAYIAAKERKRDEAFEYIRKASEKYPKNKAWKEMRIQLLLMLG